MDYDYDRQYLLGRIRIADHSDALASHTSRIRVYDQSVGVVQGLVRLPRREALLRDMPAVIRPIDRAVRTSM